MGVTGEQVCLWKGSSACICIASPSRSLIMSMEKHLVEKTAVLCKSHWTFLSAGKKRSSGRAGTTGQVEGMTSLRRPSPDVSRISIQLDLFSKTVRRGGGGGGGGGRSLTPLLGRQGKEGTLMWAIPSFSSWGKRAGCGGGDPLKTSLVFVRPPPSLASPASPARAA